MTDAVVLHFECLPRVLYSVFYVGILGAVLSANNTNLGTVHFPHFVLLIFTKPADHCHPLVLGQAVEYDQCVSRALDTFIEHC